MDYAKYPRVLCVFAVFHKGLTSLIQTEPQTSGQEGDQVDLYCQLKELRDVHQVTWQKILPHGVKNVATSNKFFGPRVDPGFSRNVRFKDEGLQNSSIVITNLTEQDGGCYRCLFNTYPDGAVTSTTCLRVYKLSGPFLHLQESNSTQEVIVSCSATGRPAPSVTIAAPQRDFFILHNDSVRVTNDDRTVTVRETAVLSRLHDNGTQVSCAAQVLSVTQRRVLTIPKNSLTPTVGGSEEESEVNSGHNQALVITLSVLLISTFALVLIIFLLRQKKGHRALPGVYEMNENNSAPNEIEFPGEDTISVRQRTTPPRNQEMKDITPSPSSVRSLVF